MVSLAVRRKLYPLDHALGRSSRVLWPWPLVVLAGLFVIATVLDAHSTRLALTLNEHAYERNPMARWFLNSFGFPGLAAWDLLRIFEYLALYVGLAGVLPRIGLPGIGRLALVCATLVYLVVGLGVISNNYLNAFA